MSKQLSRADINKLCKYLTSVRPEVFRTTYTYRMLRDTLKSLGYWKAKPRGNPYKKENGDIDVATMSSHASINTNYVIKRRWNMDLGEWEEYKVFLKKED